MQARTVPIFTFDHHQAIRIPKDMEFPDTTELQITREGDTLILCPARPDWLSYAGVAKADSDFLRKRPDVVSDEDRFSCP